MAKELSSFRLLFHVTHMEHRMQKKLHTTFKKPTRDRYHVAVETLVESIRIEGAKRNINIRDIERLSGKTFGAKFRREILIELLVNLRNKSASL